MLEPRDPGPCGCGSEEAPQLYPGSHHPRHSPRGAAPPDPALGLSRDDVALPRHAVKPETLPADEDFPPSERRWALESGPLPEADRLGPAFVMHGSESNPSILPPLSLLPPVSASGAGIVAALESNESTVKMNAQCIGGYLFRCTGTLPDLPLEGTLGPAEERLFAQGHTALESTEPGGESHTHLWTSLGKLLRWQLGLGSTSPRLTAISLAQRELKEKCAWVSLGNKDEFWQDQEHSRQITVHTEAQKQTARRTEDGWVGFKGSACRNIKLEA